MEKQTRPRPLYASRYESLRPFLRFLAWGCWHKSDFEKISGKSARSYDEGLTRAKAILPQDTLIEKMHGHRKYFMLRGDSYYGCNNFLVNSYRVKSLPPLAAFYTVVVLQILGNSTNPLNFIQIQTHEASQGEYPATVKSRGGCLEDNQLHSTLAALQRNGYVEKIGKGRYAKYRLCNNPLKDLTHRELNALLAAIGFYKNIAAVSVIGYQLEAVLQNLYRLDTLPAVPAQFQSIAFDRVLDDEILHCALEAIRLKKAMRFQYKGKKKLVFPIRVVTDFASGGRQYLIACEKKAHIVFSYRLDRIINATLAEVAPPIGSPKQPVPAHLIVRFHHEGEDKNIWRTYILDHSPKISVLSEEDDSLLCAIDDPQPLHFFPWIRSLLPNAEILSGADGLRQRMRDKIKEALQNYGHSVQ